MWQGLGLGGRVVHHLMRLHGSPPGCQTSAKLMLIGFGLPLYIRPTYRRFAYVVALMTCATAVPYSLDDI